MQWLLKLSQIPEVEQVPLFSEDARLFLESIALNFSLADARAVKGVERVTNHDVKAVEYVLKDKCRSHPELEKVHGSSVKVDSKKKYISLWWKEF